MADNIYPDKVIKSNQTECVYSATGWTQNQTDDDGHNSTSNKYAITATSNATVTITSTSPFRDAFLFVYAAKDAGIMKVTVDGQQVALKDCYLYLDGTNTMKHAALVRLKGLENKTHTVVLTCTGTKSDQSSGTKIGFSHMIMMSPDYSLEFRNRRKLLIVGDSNTASTTSWADEHIKTMLDSAFPGHQMVIEYTTRPGGTTAYLDNIENDILAKRVSAVGVMLGTNNLPVANMRERAVNDIEKLIQLCQGKNLPIFICTILPRSGVTAYYYNDYNANLRLLGARYGVPVVDINTAVTNNQVMTTSPMNSDGIHMDYIGHNIAAKQLFNTLLAPHSRFRTLLNV